VSRPTLATKAFWAAAGERAIKTAAQTAVSLLVVGATGVLDADWQAVASASGLAAVVSLLTSIGSDKLTGDGPSLTGAEVVPDKVWDWDNGGVR